LEPAPAGRIYQFWLIDFDSSLNFTGLVPLQRFQWNSEYYFAIGEDGDTLPVTMDRGLELGTNVLDHAVIGITIEPLNDPDPNSMNGPLIMAAEIGENVRANLTVDLGVPVLPFAAGTTQFSLVAPSYLKDVPGACWRDSSEGMGIWFAELAAQDREFSDTVAWCLADTCRAGTGQDTCRDSLCSPGVAKGTRFGMKYVKGQKNIRGPEDYLWIFPSHPESSFSTFGTIFANQEPNLTFRDGVAEHLTGKSGPQVALGENPIIRGGNTVGYVYYHVDTLGQVDDTCYLRVDIPESTHCASDTFAYAPFNDTGMIVRTHIYTWADTSYISSLSALVTAPPPFDLAYFGFEWEAWVVFGQSDDSTAGAIAPLSLGRFSDKNALDNSNSHFDVADLPPLFRFPGEDFLENINHPGLPTRNLNLFSLLPSMALKVWITLEPINDWAPSEPFRQLVSYSGEIRPDYALEYYQFVCQQRAPGVAPPPFMLPLGFHEVSATSGSLNEGHNWPSMRIVLRHPQQ
jgi:hypothetical protein